MSKNKLDKVHFMSLQIFLPVVNTVDEEVEKALILADRTAGNPRLKFWATKRMAKALKL